MYDLLLILPVYNEASVLEKSVNILLRYMESHFPESDYRIIIANNASTDNTADIANKLTASNKYIIHELIKIKGRGNALKEIAKKYNSKAFMYMDIDIPIDISMIKTILNYIYDGNANIVIVKRTGTRNLIRKLITKCMTVLNYFFLNIPYEDIQSGVKAFDSKVASALLPYCTENGYFLDMELVTKCVDNGLKIIEFPTEWTEKRFNERDTKVNLVKDSINAFLAIMRIFNQTINVRLKFVFSKTALILFLITIFIFSYRNSLFSEIKGPLLETSLNELHLFLFLFTIFGIILWYIIGKHYVDTKILKVAVFSSFFILLFAKPFFSQDIYWNLLHSKNFINGNNPYITKPIDYEMDSLNSVLRIWEDFPMTYGPLSVYLYAIPFLLTNNIQVALLILRTIWFLALVYSAKYIFNNLENSYVKYIFLTSPFVLLNTVLDLHNDMFVVLSLALSYYFLKKRMYAAAVLSLLPGALIKYVTLIMLPAVLINWAMQNNSKTKTLFKIAGTIFISMLLIIALYLPFTKQLNSVNELFTGLNTQANFYIQERQFIVPLILLEYKVISPANLKIVGFVIGMTLGIILLVKKKPEEAYIFSLGTLILSTSWLMPWYFLWIMPFILIRYRNVFTNLLYTTLTLIPLSFLALTIIYTSTIPFTVSVKYALKHAGLKK